MPHQLDLEAARQRQRLGGCPQRAGIGFGAERVVVGCQFHIADQCADEGLQLTQLVLGGVLDGFDAIGKLDVDGNFVFVDEGQRDRLQRFQRFQQPRPSRRRRRRWRCIRPALASGQLDLHLLAQ